MTQQEYRVVMDACDDLSDIIETWNGTGITDERLHTALSKVRDLLDPIYKAGIESHADKDTE